MKALTGTLLALPMPVTAGGNTVEGARKEVKAGGQAIECAADKAKPN